MPRDGSGIYSIPPGTQGAPNTTIESAKYNAFAADLETDLNAARPIIAGGTGGTSAAGARTALGAERSMQVVTNFDTQVWEAGSFSSAAGATSAPVAGHAFAGIVYGPDANNLVIEARDLNDTATPGIKYVKEKTAGVWAPAWTSDASTMTGDLTIQKSAPILTLDRTDAAATAIRGSKGGLLRWQIVPGDALVAETGGNVGSDFLINRCNDAGAGIDTPFAINRATGLVTATGLPSYGQAQTLTDVQTLQARQNIAAAPLDVLAYSGMQVNGNFEVAQELGPNNRVVGIDSTLCDVVRLFGTAQHTLNAAQGTAYGPIAWKNTLQISAGVGSAVINAGDTIGLAHLIEGNRSSQLFSGTAQARPITVGLWVYSNVPGTIGVHLGNSGASRSCVQSITIAANTWEYRVVTFPGDTTGTWFNDNRRGLQCIISLATGSTYRTPTLGVWQNGTLYAPTGQTNFFAATGSVVAFGGVMILPGTQAPTAAQSLYVMRPFEQEQFAVQRYYAKTYNYTDLPGAGAPSGGLLSSGLGVPSRPFFCWSYPRVMRTAPAITHFSPASGASGMMRNLNMNRDETVIDYSIGAAAVGFYPSTNIAAIGDGMSAHVVADARL